MQCTQCQREVPAGSAFCPQCGADLDDSARLTGDAPTSTQSVSASARGRGGSPNEEEIWSGSYSAKAMAGTFLAAGALTIVAFVIGAFFAIPGIVAVLIGALFVWAGLILLYFYRRYTVRYRLTTFRFFHETGLLSRTGNRVEVIDIDDVTVHQGLIERMFDVGTIQVNSSDKTHPELQLPGIDEAKRVADLIDGARRAERHRRGLHIESI